MNEDIEQIIELSNRVSRTTIAVIDAMAQRGAYKGEEMLTVGQLREQCGQLIQLVEAAMTAEQEAGAPISPKKK